MRTRQKQSVATDTWRSLKCRTTPLEHWSKRKATVEHRWARQEVNSLDNSVVVHELEFAIKRDLRGVIDKFVSFFHRIIIYGWIYIIFCHYQQQSVVNQKKTLKCNVRDLCDVTMTMMTLYIGDVVVKTLVDVGCTITGFKCYSTSAIIVKFPDNICT